MDIFILKMWNFVMKKTKYMQIFFVPKKLESSLQNFKSIFF